MSTDYKKIANENAHYSQAFELMCLLIKNEQQMDKNRDMNIKDRNKDMAKGYKLALGYILSIAESMKINYSLVAENPEIYQVKYDGHNFKLDFRK